MGLGLERLGLPEEVDAAVVREVVEELGAAELGGEAPSQAELRALEVLEERGLQEEAKRVSKHSTRRNLNSHPDVALVDDIRVALLTASEGSAQCDSNEDSTAASEQRDTGKRTSGTRTNYLDMCTRPA